MGQFYYITYSSDLGNSQLIKDRIKQFNDYINFLDCNWFIYTEESLQNVYEKVSKDEFENDRILVLKVDFTNYWGRMQKSLWEWIKKER